MGKVVAAQDFGHAWIFCKEGKSAGPLSANPRDLSPGELFDLTWLKVRASVLAV
jgi:hypothetical protein